MPGHANLQTGYSCGCSSEDIISSLLYGLYSYETNKGEVLSKIVVYEFEHIRMKGRMCVL